MEWFLVWLNCRQVQVVAVNRASETACQHACQTSWPFLWMRRDGESQQERSRINWARWEEIKMNTGEVRGWEKTRRRKTKKWRNEREECTQIQTALTNNHGNCSLHFNPSCSCCYGHLSIKTQPPPLPHPILGLFIEALDLTSWNSCNYPAEPSPPWCPHSVWLTLQNPIWRKFWHYKSNIKDVVTSSLFFGKQFTQKLNYFINTILKNWLWTHLNLEIIYFQI